MTQQVRLLQWYEVRKLAVAMATNILLSLDEDVLTTKVVNVYGVPRGGIYVASMIDGMVLPHPDKDDDSTIQFQVVGDLSVADVVVDDLVDSGATMDRFLEKENCDSFAYLIDKRMDKWKDEWIEFPWESAVNEAPAEDAIVRMLEFIGEDPNREGLKDTPKRVAKAWAEIFSGYGEDPAEYCTVFDEKNTGCEWVTLAGIEFHSTCEHHIQPFSGYATVSYKPRRVGSRHHKVIGISKLARIVDTFAKRLQVQERLTNQVGDCLSSLVDPDSIHIVIEAKHSCVSCRGVQKQKSIMFSEKVWSQPDPNIWDKHQRAING